MWEFKFFSSCFALLGHLEERMSGSTWLIAFLAMKGLWSNWKPKFGVRYALWSIKWENNVTKKSVSSESWVKITLNSYHIFPVSGSLDIVLLVERYISGAEALDIAEQDLMCISCHTQWYLLFEAFPFELYHLLVFGAWVLLHDWKGQSEAQGTGGENQEWGQSLDLSEYNFQHFSHSE